MARSVAARVYPARSEIKSRLAPGRLEVTTRSTRAAPILALRTEAVRAFAWENALWLALGASAAAALLLGFWI